MWLICDCMAELTCPIHSLSAHVIGACHYVHLHIRETYTLASNEPYRSCDYTACGSTEIHVVEKKIVCSHMSGQDPDRSCKPFEVELDLIYQFAWKMSRLCSFFLASMYLVVVRAAT